MKIIYRDSAVEDIVRAGIWYDTISKNLGEEFYNELTNTINRLKQYPLAGNPLNAGGRIVWLGKFPYSIIYKYYPRKKEMIILGVFHTSQNLSVRNKRK